MALRAIDKPAFVPVDPEERNRELDWMRKVHDVQEGDKLMIRTAYGFTETLNVYDIPVQVEAIEQHFIVLRYPEGFLVSFRWRDFEKIRLKQ